MIQLVTGQVGLSPLTSSLRLNQPSNQRTLVLVHSAAARASAETLILQAQPPDGQVIASQVCTPVDLARTVLIAAGRSVPELLGSVDRRRMLQQFLVKTGDLTPTDSTTAADHAAELVADFGRAFDDARLASAGPAEITVHALAADAPGWLRIADLVDEWPRYLANSNMIDRVGLLCQAMSAARSTDAVEAWWTNTDHLIVTDAHRIAAPVARLLTSLLGPSKPAHAAATVWGTSVPLKLFNHAPPLAQPPAPQLARRLVRCGHPALEPEAAVAEAQHAAAAGVAWSDIVIVATSHERLRAVVRSARRAEVPISGAPAPRLEGPVVSAIAERARNAEALHHTTEANHNPALLMRSVMRERSATLTAGTIEGETLIALYNHAVRHGHLTSSQWADLLDTAPVAGTLPLPAPSDAVSLCTIDELLDRATQPRLTILLGCVEGTLPARRPHRDFDPSILDGPSGLATADLAHLNSQRERFWSVELATDTAGQVVYIAAPEPGVLVSRFTEGLVAEPPRLPLRKIDSERWPIGLRPTVNPRPLVQERSLQLSASQINVYDNCPWQHAVQYRLNLRTEGGLQARFGTYIHLVLERFVLGIGSTLPHPPHTQSNSGETSHRSTARDAQTVAPNPHGSHLDGLLTLADECWSDDIADYAPQVDDYRRRAKAMLTDWWEREGEDLVQSRRAAFTEYRFRVAVGDHVVTGFIDRIDRIDRVETSGGPERLSGLSIVDYKTGGTPKSAADTNDDLQLAVYHLAANLDPTLAGFGPVQALALDFVAANKQVTQAVTEDHVQRTSARIIEVANRMLAEETAPSVNANCEYCDLARLCDLQAEGRPVPVRVNP